MRTLLILVLLAVPASAESVDEEASKLVFRLIDDYQSNHKTIYKSNFAFVGRTMEESVSGTTESPPDRWYLCVFESDTRRLDASSYSPNNNLGRHLEKWSETLQYDSKEYLRTSTPALGHRRVSSSDDADWKEHLDAAEFHAIPRPLCNMFLSPGFGYFRWTAPNRRCGSEFLNSEDAELIKASIKENGDVVATFAIKSNFPVEDEITFGQESGLFPVRHLRSLTIGGVKRVHQEVRVHWTRMDEYAYPNVVHITKHNLSAPPGDPPKEIKVVFDWKFGDDVHGSLNPKSTDWRKPFQLLFDTNWQTMQARRRFRPR